MKLGTDQSESCLFLNGRAFPRPRSSVPGYKNVHKTICPWKQLIFGALLLHTKRCLSLLIFVAVKIEKP